MFNKALFAIFAMVMVQGVVSVPQIGFPVACTGAGDPTCTANGQVCCDLTSVGLGLLCVYQPAGDPWTMTHSSLTAANPCLLFARLESGTSGILMQAVGL
ncbi:hypothetical protein B0H14DRAFT_3436383 [Mycena olivaceomarginata]|nr:hypothetical protein B0H14DRAFT_3436383 [Mycena olivaceomarginata]